MIETLSPTLPHKDFKQTTYITLDRLTSALNGAFASGAPASRMNAADRAEYLAMLRGEHPDHELPEEQAHKLLDALWSIMVACIDLGFPPCGQLGMNTPVKCDKAGRNALHSHHTKQNKNTESAATADRRES